MDEVTKMEIKLVSGATLFMAVLITGVVITRNKLDNVPTQVIYEGKVVHRGPSCSVRIGSAGNKPKVTIMGGPLYLVTKAVYAGDSVTVEGAELPEVRP